MIEQSVLHAAGPQAARIESLWWFLFWTATIVFIVVMAALAYAIWRRREPHEREPILDNEQREKKMRGSVGGAVLATVIILFVFLFESFSTGKAIGGMPRERMITVEIVGHQWWWEVRYADPMASRIAVTANEVHVPVGVPVRFRLSSLDVIHSLWVPNLHGKKDMIPGHITETWFQADTPGVYRGQCAEFCGHQHAKMALFIVAEAPSKYEEWLNRQREPAPQPTDSIRKHGQQVFLSSSCAMCHSIGGTGAGASGGPDLTHVGGRISIAAGTLPNTRGNLAGWIVDPQGIKPGVRMPSNAIASGDLQALLAYLESLK